MTDKMRCFSAFMCFWNRTEEWALKSDGFLRKDACFIIRDPLQQLELIDSEPQKLSTRNINIYEMSFESVNYPHHFLKYFDGNVVVQKLRHTKQDNKSATWIFEQGLCTF